jgi:hypothetical protein
MVIYGLANSGFFAWGFYQFVQKDYELQLNALGLIISLFFVIV